MYQSVLHHKAMEKWGYSTTLRVLRPWCPREGGMRNPEGWDHGSFSHNLYFNHFTWCIAHLQPCEEVKGSGKAAGRVDCALL